MRPWGRFEYELIYVDDGSGRQPCGAARFADAFHQAEGAMPCPCRGPEHGGAERSAPRAWRLAGGTRRRWSERSRRHSRHAGGGDAPLPERSIPGGPHRPPGQPPRRLGQASLFKAGQRFRATCCCATAFRIPAAGSGRASRLVSETACLQSHAPLHPRADPGSRGAWRPGRSTTGHARRASPNTGSGTGSGSGWWTWSGVWWLQRRSKVVEIREMLE